MRREELGGGRGGGSPLMRGRGVGQGEGAGKSPNKGGGAEHGGKGPG
jgi:hypothetical protein